jgi:serine protease Do
VSKVGFKASSSTIVDQRVVQEESDTINVVKKVSPSVVSVVAKTSSFDMFNGPTQSEQGIGTGFIVGSNGLIVTNSHVVDDPSAQYAVVLNDGSSYDVNKINLDENSDLALLQITGKNLPTVTLGDSSSLQVGQRAIAIGNALGTFQNTVTVGVVSGIARQLTASGGFNGQTKVYENAIQTDAAINPGNSGGPLLNSSGQVIGINVATSVGANNISFAIPINQLKPVLTSFLKNGKIVKPFLGVQYQVITKEMAALKKIPEGAFVSAVVADSPAAKAGLKQGDVIVSVDGKALVDNVSLATEIAQKHIGDTVTIGVNRDGQNLTLKAVLIEMPTNLGQ